MLLTGAAFYWFEVRPTRVRAACNSAAENSESTAILPGSLSVLEIYNQSYVTCLRRYGLEP